MARPAPGLVPVVNDPHRTSRLWWIADAVYKGPVLPIMRVCSILRLNRPVIRWMSIEEASQSGGIIFLVSLIDMAQLLTSAIRGVFCFGGVLHEVEEILLGGIGMLILSGVPAVQAGSIALSTSTLGREDFMTYCTTCHCVSEKGGGVIAEFLKIALTNLTQMSMQNGGEFKRQRAIEVIDGRAQAAQ